MPSLRNCFFVTGTDTSSGKTTVTRYLIQALQQQGFSAVGCKPIACGLNEKGENEDVVIYQSVNSLTLPSSLLNPYCFTVPASPNLAAAAENQHVTVSTLIQKLEPIKKTPADFIFFEGVGGWKVPINDHETMIEVATQLKVPLILIIGIRVGCLNHALLTWEAIQKEKIEVAGWIGNIVCEETPLIEGHINTLKNWIESPYLGLLPFGKPMNANIAINKLIEYHQ